jgi:ubiquinone/menaquinone biosynthesis C-methylase UbiE
MKSNDFDRIAFLYDRLAQFVFGKNMIESQTFFLNKIPHTARVLILGGGSGWILEKIFEVSPSFNVCYVEASISMISLAKKKMQNNEQIQFIHGTEKDIPNQQFDVVVTNFYLDLFEKDSLDLVLKKIKDHLSQDAAWIATDFVNKNWKHGLTLRVMYIFFKITSRIEAGKLPDWDRAIEALGAKKIESKLFYGSFIETGYYQI